MKHRDDRHSLKLKIKQRTETVRKILSIEKRVPPDPLHRTWQGFRMGDLRGSTRSALLAYGFLRGREYSAMEPRCRKGGGPDWAGVEEAVRVYGSPRRDLNLGDADRNLAIDILRERWLRWESRAQDYLWFMNLKGV
jgi:hypothetical protein